MRNLRVFDTVEEMNSVLDNSEIGIVGLAYDNDENPVVKIHAYVPTPPTNLVISCSENIVTITADNATTIEYNFDGSSTYTTYTEPFEITQTVTVYAKATNADGSITGSQVCEYVKPIDYSIPFYVEDVSGSNNTVQLFKGGTSGTAPQLTIEKSINGINWEIMGTTSTSAISATVPANGKLYLRCKTATFGAHQQDTFNHINCTNNYKIGGNIMSLLYGNEFTGNETQFPENSTYTFYKTFYGNNKLTDCSKLLLPSSAVYACYQYMFNGCTSLTTAPALPATTLADECYKYMFQGCTSLTTPPELSATTLAKECCYNMFYGCTSLATAPALPATTLAKSCYSSMFSGCTSLTTAPELPATTLAQGCYGSMFKNCTSLTAAPVLHATTMADSCYTEMFNGCTKLNYIKCLATNISATYHTYNWVSGVSSTGTFVKDASTEWPTGANGIPDGWTIQDAQ